MTCFKSGFQIFLLMLLSFTLSACIPKTQDRPEGTGSGGANFVVATVSGSIVASKNVGEFPLPGERTYNFKACLIDFSRRTNIPNAKFLVKELDNKELTTDSQGCLNWPEVIKYNYLSDSIWLKITRTFTATGLQRGTQEVHFAINPWSHGENLAEVLDLAKQSTPYLIEDAKEVQARLLGKNKTRTIWLESGEVNATNGKRQGQAYAWHDQIFLKPQIQFSKTDSTPVLISLSAGSFKAEVSLISENVQDKKIARKIWAKQIVEKATITNGTLMIDVDFSLIERPKSGQTFLGLKLIPIGANEGLLPFEGVFPLGGANAFTQSTGLKISQTVAAENSKGQFSIKQFMGSAGELTVTSDNSVKASIHVEHFHMSDFKIATEQGQKKSLSYRNQTCLTNTVGDFGLANHEFKVDILNASNTVIESKTVTSDVNSCLYWESRTEEFDLNECRHYISQSIRIHSDDDLGMDQTEKILINPWLTKALDQREATDVKQYATTCEGKEGLSQADNIVALRSMTLTRLVYHPQVLDRTLKLSQQAVFGIDIADAGFLDYSNETSGLATTSKTFSAGKYLLRLAFVRKANPRPDNGYVTHADVILDSVGGALTGKVELNIKDLQATMIRKTVLAQLFPIDIDKYNSKKWTNNDPDIESLIDKKTKLISPVYASEAVSFAAAGRVLFAQKADGIPSLAETITKGFKLNPTSSTLIHDIVTSGEAAQAAMIKQNAFNEADPKAWAQWSREQNLDLIWLSDAKSVDYLKNQFKLKGDAKPLLQNLVTMDKLDSGWANQFCHILASGPYKSLSTAEDFEGMFTEYCLRTVKNNPSEFIKKSTAYRVLTMQPATIRPQTLTVSSLSVSSSFGYAKGHTEVDGTQSSLSLSGNLGTPSKFGASAGIGASYGAVHMKTDDLNKHAGNDVASGMGFTVTKWEMDIPVTSYQQCTVLRVDPTALLTGAGFSVYEPSTWNIWKIGLRNRLNLTGLFKPNVTPNPLFKGWLICSDIVTKEKIVLPETYHVLSQGNGDSETFDSIDELNRRFFLPLRGTDMARFKANLVDKLDYPENGEVTDEIRSDLAKKLSPLMRRLDPAPGMIVYDPQDQTPESANTQGGWGF